MNFDEENEAVSNTEEPDYYNPAFFRTENFVYSENIKTVLFHQTEAVVSYPIINLGNGTLKLSFDDLDNYPKDYFYEILHCDINWNYSNLSESQYMEGINGMPLLDYFLSTNTSNKYHHYQLSIPNNDFRFIRSGNYMLNIYLNKDGSKTPVLSRRLMVYEQLVGIKPQLRRPYNHPDNDTKQEIDFTVLHPNFDFFNAFTDVKAVVLQNGRWDNAITNLPPTFIRDHQLIFDFSGKCIFEGGNEFRILDLRSTTGGNEKIKNIEREGNQFNVELRNDLIRSKNLHSYSFDRNGAFLINNWYSSNTALSGEYMQVHFSLPFDKPPANGNFYLNGLFTDWRSQESYKLHYNYATKAYEKTILLKQGEYNYEYIFLEDGRETGTASIIEGSYFETENEYIILVYYKGVQEIFHKLIGHLTFKTR